MAQEYLKEYRRLTSNDDLQAPSVVKSYQNQNQYQQLPPTKLNHTVAKAVTRADKPPNDFEFENQILIDQADPETAAEQKQGSRRCGREDEICPNMRKLKR